MVRGEFSSSLGKRQGCFSNVVLFLFKDHTELLARLRHGSIRLPVSIESAMANSKLQSRDCCQTYLRFTRAVGSLSISPYSHLIFIFVALKML